MNRSRKPHSSSHGTTHPIRPSRWRSVTFLAVGSLVLAAEGLRADPTWQVFQLTSGSQTDVSADVNGTTYVWQRGVTGDLAIMKWSEGDTDPVNIADNVKANAPRIHGGRIVWASRSNSFTDYDIRLWDNGNLTTLLDDDQDDGMPAIGGYGIAWFRQFGNIVYYDGLTETHLTGRESGSDLDQYPSVFDGWVAWEAGDPDQEIFFWNNGVQVQLTNNAYNDLRPETDGSTIVWYATPGPNNSGSAVFRWKPSTGALQLTEDSLFAWQPDVSGDVIVFSGWDGHDYEIFFRYFGVNYQITDNDFPDYEPQVDGDRVVWLGRDDPPSSNYHVYYAILGNLAGGVPPGACCVGLRAPKNTHV